MNNFKIRFNYSNLNFKIVYACLKIFRINVKFDMLQFPSKYLIRLYKLILKIFLDFILK